MDKTCTGTESNSVETAAAEPIFAWNVHILRENPGKLLFVIPVLAFSLFACYAIFQSPLFMAVAFLMFIASLADYLFPVKYEITKKGASARTLFGRSFIEWDRVLKYYIDKDGIKLSPLPRPSRLEAFRGVYLRFGAHKDQVADTVRRMRDVQHAAGRTTG